MNFLRFFLNSFVVAISAATIAGCSKGSGGSTPPPPPPPPPPPVSQDWKFETALLWSDEFDVDGVVSNTKWSYDVGGGGWGNNELEYYTSGLNDSVKNGILNIVARKESFGGRNYTSARIVTKDKGDWLYGRFEIRAKLPRGRGTWPAIWMLPTENFYGGWPNSGEIDIMEHVGYDPEKVHFNLHAKAFYGANGRGQSMMIPGAMDAFHIYRLDWAPYGIRGYMDGEKVFEYSNPNAGSDHWPYDKKFHMLINIAVGGNWGGAQGVDDTIFPATLQVDYVRVYKYIQ